MPKRRRFTGLSRNPVTDLILTDIALRGVARLSRHYAEKKLLKTRYDSETAKQVVEQRSISQTLLATAAARLATRSVPGAAITVVGILGKALHDRSKGKRDALREERKQLRAPVAETDENSAT